MAVSIIVNAVEVRATLRPGPDGWASKVNGLLNVDTGELAYFDAKAGTVRVVGPEGWLALIGPSERNGA